MLPNEDTGSVVLNRSLTLYLTLLGIGFGNKENMANTKQVICLIMLVLLFARLESRSLETFMESTKTPSKRELIQKSQLLKASFAKAGRFTNPTVSKRLSPEGPDHRHH
ncbi:hypothetical protein VNO77_28454 [Canavalia gladiata]|uniref:Uncharacterized protein n=1 Tax=Canavalia gladiata TaxID=3824 RepID=A0AAN9Q791_CANGL